MAVAGMAAGCLLGYAIAIYLAESWLDEYSTLVAQQQDAASEEATKALASIKASPHPACSDAELAYFRGHAVTTAEVVFPVNEHRAFRQ